MSPKGSSDEDFRTLFHKLRRGVREHRICWRELEQLANRPSKKEIPEIRRKYVDSLREIAKEIDDPKTKAGVLAIVACESGDDMDLDIAFHEVFEMQNGDQAKAIAVIAATLAQGGKIDLARQIAGRIDDYPFWEAETWMAVGSFSKDPNDFQVARHRAKRITDKATRDEVMTDIARQEKMPKKSHLCFQNRIQELDGLRRLLETLATVTGFAKTHCIVSEFSSARERALASAIVLEMLALKMP